jgi:chain length determinant protein EpsF
MNIRQFLLIMRARWRIVVTFVIVAVLLTAAISLLLPKQYIATATVLADIKADPVAGNNAGPAQMAANYIATQVDVVNSERVARHVVEILKLDRDPKSRQQWIKMTGGRGDLVSWIAEGLRRHLQVSPSRESNVISIGFQWTEAQQAAIFANAFAQSYIDTNVELKVTPAKQYAEWFKERSDALSSDLAAKQRQLADFQRDQGIVATGERLDIEASRLAELSTQLVQIQGQREDSQSRQKQHGKADAVPEVLQSSVVNALKVQLAGAEVKLGDLRKLLGESHPKYIEAQSEVTELRERIAQESATIVRSMNTVTEVNGQRESATHAAFEAQKTRVLEMKHQQDQAGILEGAVLTAQRNLDAVNQRLAQTSLESLSQQTTLVMLTPATAPFLRSSPKLRVNVLVALFLGTILGVASALLLEHNDQRVRSAEDLMQVVDLPMLGRIRAATAGIIQSANTASLARRGGFLPMPTQSE